MRLEKKATVVSTSVAGLLVIMKMTVGILSGSIAVLASAIDSFLDLIVSLFNFFALNTAEAAPNEDFNFGKGKMEPLAAVIEGTVISLSALFILYEALQKIINPQEMLYMSESIVVMFISIIITLLLVMFLNYVANKTNNLVIKADALHYKTDIFSNAAVLVAIGLVALTDEQIIDAVIGLGIAIYMIYSAIPIIKEGLLMLLDAALPEEDVEKIQAAITKHNAVTDYHFLTTRESGSHIFISVHAVFNVTISLYDAHLVADKIENEWRNLFPDKKVHALVHMDPYDDSEINKEEGKY
ncbi:cation transporter [Sulfurimonas lithotrophica]|uniref:Cation transporter n=1 Tax=Sulfurimonas lithotrophica TaxID=2590022 RepID=A0A5P8P1R3_9BACT|nr:cation diffusion facilitator family transporter [Sulfurimonas lithotrophica]QFR49527.1 cation transporter [Sulfurimonas lithotrophica]